MILLFLLLVVLFLPTSVQAWGAHGHRAISDAVQASLDPATITALARITGTGDEFTPGLLARLSMWPDEIRPLTRNPYTVVSGFTPAELQEAHAFVQAHPDSKPWHYVDLPPGASQYPSLLHPDAADPALPFTSPQDIVHMIHRCVEILEREPEPPEFTKLQALRWLLHLVEDLHQPLHVVSGYYRTTEERLGKPEIIADPTMALQAHARMIAAGIYYCFSRSRNVPRNPREKTSMRSGMTVSWTS